MTPHKFVRGQTVYSEGSQAKNIFIVYKGEFEMAKRLPKLDRQYEGANLNALGANSN